MSKPSEPQMEFVRLTPDEVAQLLGITKQDVIDHRPGIWRVPQLFVDRRHEDGASADLSVEDFCAWFGASRRSVVRYLSASSIPRLLHKRMFCSGRIRNMIAPANAFFFFRERNRLAGGTVEVRETAGRRTQRNRDMKARAAELCGDTPVA